MFKKMSTEVKILSVFLLVLLMINTCTNASQNRKIKNLESIVMTSDSSIKKLTKTCVTRDDLEIQGLKNEKRFIEATDRKILDVNRQVEIENEIKKLSKGE